MTILEQKYTGFADETLPLNPMQELVVPYMDSHDNILVVAQTSSGKSTLIPMVGQKYVEAGKKIVYIGCNKSLVEEKLADWKEDHHHWKDIPKSIVTGDYVYDENKLEELRASQLVVMTPEALCSKIRLSDAELWLKDVGILVVDEIHLIGDESRGGNLEAMLVELTKDYPSIQLLGLSATVPNADDLKTFMTQLNGKDTVLIKSDYRPVPLEYHFVEYDGGSKAYAERNKINAIINLVESRPDEQFLVGVFNRIFGENVLQELKKRGVKAEYHNATKTKSQRNMIEASFKNGTTRVLVSTSTTFVGVNLPARNVISASVTIGPMDIPASTLQQLAG